MILKLRTPGHWQGQKPGAKKQRVSVVDLSRGQRVSVVDLSRGQRVYAVDPNKILLYEKQ